MIIIIYCNTSYGNAVFLLNQFFQLYQKCGSSCFTGKCSYSSNYYIFQSTPVSESVRPFSLALNGLVSLVHGIPYWSPHTDSTLLGGTHSHQWHLLLMPSIHKSDAFSILTKQLQYLQFEVWNFLSLYNLLIEDLLLLWILATSAHYFPLPYWVQNFVM